MTQPYDPTRAGGASAAEPDPDRTVLRPAPGAAAQPSAPQTAALTGTTTLTETAASPAAGPLLAPAASTSTAVATVSGHEIATLPPQPAPTVAGHPVSVRTGEPKRPVLLGAACGLLYGGAAVAAAGLLKVLWDSSTVAKFPTAARMFTWVTDLQPVSFTAIVMVLLAAAVGAVVATAAGVAAYNAWNGVEWARIAGIVAAAISLLTILLNPLAMVAMVPIAVGAGLLWLPQLRSYFDAWRRLRTPHLTGRHLATDVVYGPLPRYV